MLSQAINDQNSADTDTDVFKSIFRDHWDEFTTRFPQYNTEQYNEPVEKMLGCREHWGGYAEYLCLYCGKGTIKVPFSCKSCFCLSCCKKYVDDFVSTISKMLHAGVIYRHIVLTLPEQLRVKFFHERHDGELLSAFMRCGYECLEDVVSTAKKKGLKIGCIVVVQTHGRSGRYNPHLHIIMTSGGVDTKSGNWFDLGYFDYKIIHRKWQYHLLTMVKSYFGTQVNRIVDALWKKYTKGFVANISKGEVPDNCKGLAVYLAKYVASPPIAVRRIVSYDGQTVGYWYQDHKTEAKQFEVVDVMTFIGRMVQHILPKWFQRVRYYGLQATKTFNKWKEVIQKAVSKVKNIIKGAYQVVRKKTYRERYEEMSGRDPLVCGYCGHEMELWKIWHPKYGIIFDEYENLKSGEYGTDQEESGGGSGHTIRPATCGIQLPLFPMPA